MKTPLFNPYDFTAFHYVIARITPMLNKPVVGSEYQTNLVPIVTNDCLLGSSKKFHGDGLEVWNVDRYPDPTTIKIGVDKKYMEEALRRLNAYPTNNLLFRNKNIINIIYNPPGTEKHYKISIMAVDYYGMKISDFYQWVEHVGYEEIENNMYVSLRHRLINAITTNTDYVFSSINGLRKRDNNDYITDLQMVIDILFKEGGKAEDYDTLKKLLNYIFSMPNQSRAKVILDKFNDMLSDEKLITREQIPTLNAWVKDAALKNNNSYKWKDIEPWEITSL